MRTVYIGMYRKLYVCTWVHVLYTQVYHSYIGMYVCILFPKKNTIPFSSWTKRNGQFQANVVNNWLPSIDISSILDEDDNLNRHFMYHFLCRVVIKKPEVAYFHVSSVWPAVTDSKTTFKIYLFYLQFWYIIEIPLNFTFLVWKYTIWQPWYVGLADRIGLNIHMYVHSFINGLQILDDKHLKLVTNLRLL
jgi:hypothetical protein